MKKIAGRVLAMALAVSLLLTGISFPAKAEGQGAGEALDVEDYSAPDTLDGFQEAVAELNEEMPVESDGKFASRRLIVVSDNVEFETYGAESAVSFENVHVLSYGTEKGCSDAYSKLSKDESVDSVEVDMLMEAEEAGDEAGEEKEAVHTVNTELKDFLDSKEAEKEVTVAILDTGISKELLELDEVVDTKINLSGSGAENSVIDDNGHGTDMASLILLNGNEKTKVMPIKIADENGIATVLNAYIGIRQAVELGADIVNISMNAKKSAASRILSDAIDDASANGTVVVVSAGNDGIDTKSVVPANIESAVVISALDGDNEIAGYSNYGDTVDYCSFGNYEGKSGTSYAAAGASGILANALSKGMTEEEMRGYAVNLWATEDSGLYGNGLLAYEYKIYDNDEDGGSDDGEEEDDGRDKNIVLMTINVLSGDEGFDIQSNFGGISYDKKVYDVKFVSCEPEFDINTEGKYECSYKFMDRKTKSERVYSRNIKVIEDDGSIRNTDLSISELPAKELYDKDLKDASKEKIEYQQRAYTIAALMEDWPNLEFDEKQSSFGHTYALADIALQALQECANAVKKSENKDLWIEMYRYGRRLFNLEIYTNIKYDPKYEGKAPDDIKYVGERDEYTRTPVKAGNHEEEAPCPVKINGRDNLLGCILVYEIGRKYGNIEEVEDSDDAAVQNCDIFTRNDTIYTPDNIQRVRDNLAIMYADEYCHTNLRYELNTLFLAMKDGQHMEGSFSSYSDYIGNKMKKISKKIVNDKSWNFSGSEYSEDEVMKNNCETEWDENEKKKVLTYDDNGDAILKDIGEGNQKTSVFQHCAKLFMNGGSDYKIGRNCCFLLVQAFDLINGGVKARGDEYYNSIVNTQYNRTGDTLTTEEGDKDGKKNYVAGFPAEYRILKGWGGSYGEATPGYISFDGYKTEYTIDQRAYNRTDASDYGLSYVNDKNRDDMKTYTGVTNFLLKKDQKEKMSEWLTYNNLYGKGKNIKLYAGDVIYCKMRGSACSHVGVYGRTMLCKPENKGADALDECGFFVLENSVKNHDENAGEELSRYVVTKTGLYSIQVQGLCFACQYASIWLCSDAMTDVFTQKYTITYSAVDDEGHAITFQNHSDNKTSYTQHDTPMTIKDPSKQGWVFDGWTLVSDKQPMKENGTEDKLEQITKNPVIEEGSYGNRHYVAHFHQPRYTVIHKYRQLGGGWETYINTFKDLIGAVVTPEPRNREGFEFQGPRKTVTVQADGSTEVVYEYERISYGCKVIDIDDGDGSVFENGERDLGLMPYGSLVSNSEIGTDTAFGAYHEGYSLVKINTNYVPKSVSDGYTVGAGENIIYRHFKKGKPDGKMEYTVRHWLLDKNQNRLELPFAVDYGDSAVNISIMTRPRTHEEPVLEERVPLSNKIPSPVTCTITYDGDNVFDVEYPYKTYTVKCEDYIYDAGGVYNSRNWIGNASGVTKEVLYEDTVSGADFGDDDTVNRYYNDYVYLANLNETVTANDDTADSEGVITVRRHFEKRGYYTVTHMYKQLDGTYLMEPPVNEYNLFGYSVGDGKTAERRSKEGYKNPDSQTVTRQRDGTASPSEVIYKYDFDPDACKVQFIDVVEKTGQILGPTPERIESRNIGDTVHGSDIGDDKTVGAYYPGYAYSGCTTIKVELGRNTVYRYFTDMHVTYTVIHQLQNAKNREKFDTPADGIDDTKSGVKGTSVTEYPREKYASMGYIIPPSQTVTLGDDTVIIFKYYLTDPGDEAEYKVYHMVESLENGMSLYRIDTKTAKIGSSVTPERLNLGEGYDMPLPQTIDL